ncbi:cytochrome P450 family protein [Kineosporia succinea]|uniref:Cytochrome P450 n=1 Tax=Kineosporia succinea TaxID=84632 RepID=A0ABT9NZW7_9ACTN|nr:cytochrome P450 [Kineosporia succinea]MDP9825704.1 cytochrome P450 [Kineosporia succinea]
MTQTPPPGCPAHQSHAGMPLIDATGAPDHRVVFRELRENHGPVVKVELEPGVEAWLVMGYRELLSVTRDERLFGHDARNWRDLNDGLVAPDSGLLPMMGWRPNVFQADGEEHRRLRRPVDEAIAGIDQRAVRREIEEICTDLIAAFSGRGSADLIAEYAQVIPTLALASLFGLDREGGQELRRALIALFGSQENSQAGDRAFDQILVDLVLSREHDGGRKDVTSVIVRHESLNSLEERVQTLVPLIGAGNETMTSWIAHTLRLLMTDPRFSGQLRGGSLGVDDALDEALWREPPMNVMPARYALQDTELGGQKIRKGDVLVLGLGAVVDDPMMQTGNGPIAEPGNRAHLAFAAGPHSCPARVPARVIVRTAVGTVLNLLPDLRLSVPAEDLTWFPSPWTRVPTALPVEFSTVEPATPETRA